MRVPMLLAGAASVWLFYLLLRRIAGERAALIGCGLLAADSLYLLDHLLRLGSGRAAAPAARRRHVAAGGLLPGAQRAGARLGRLLAGPGDVG